MSAPYDDGECVSCNRLSAEMAKLRAERDELAAQVEVMRDAIGEAMGWNWLSDVESIPESVSKQIADALTTPNTAAAILRQRDARTLREAADSLDAWGGICEQPAHDFLRKLADAMESGE